MCACLLVRCVRHLRINLYYYIIEQQYNVYTIFEQHEYFYDYYLQILFGEHKHLFAICMIMKAEFMTREFYTKTKDNKTRKHDRYLFKQTHSSDKPFQQYVPNLSSHHQQVAAVYQLRSACRKATEEEHRRKAGAAAVNRSDSVCDSGCMCRKCVGGIAPWAPLDVYPLTIACGRGEEPAVSF